MHIPKIIIFSVFILSFSCKPKVLEEPNASFNWEKDSLTVSFTNTTTGEEIESYSWWFGDDNYSFDENPIHTYDSAGTYQVILRAANVAGHGRDTQLVVVP
jgi:PKD repeat protein